MLVNGGHPRPWVHEAVPPPSSLAVPRQRQIKSYHPPLEIPHVYLAGPRAAGVCQTYFADDRKESNIELNRININGLRMTGFGRRSRA